MTFIQNKRNILFIFFLYSVSNFFLLLNYDGIYWDDWVLKNQTIDTIKSIFFTNGNFMKFYIHNFLLTSFISVEVYRSIVFILYFLSGLFVYKLTSKIDVLKEYKILITLIYLVVPLNSAKIALINVPAIIFLFIFFLSFYLLSIYLVKKQNYFLRIIILFLFFLSFMQASLLIFYILPLLYIFYFIYRNNKRKKGYYKYLLKYVDFITLPILYYSLKNLFFKPYGLYADYNQIHIGVSTFKLIIKSFSTSFVDPIYYAFFASLEHLYIFLPVSMLLYIFISKLVFQKKDVKILFSLFGFGIFIFVIAVFPYAVVGKLPHLFGWESRHQLLIPLGYSFILLSLYLFTKRKYDFFSNILLSIIISMFISATYANNFKYERDWFYQLALEKNMQKSNIIRNNSTFIVNLENSNVLANHRNISFYEFGGHSKKAFGVDNKLFVENVNDIKVYFQYKEYKQYNFSHWSYKKPILLEVRFNPISTVQMYRLVYLYIIQKDDFNKEIIKYVIIRKKNV